MFFESKGKLYLCVIDQAYSVKMPGVLMDRDEVERKSVLEGDYQDDAVSRTEGFVNLT